MHYQAHRHALSKPMQLSLCLVVLALSLAVLVLGSRLLMANLNQYRASSFLSDWEGKRQAPSDRAWQVAEQAMQQGIAWYPGENAAYVEQLGYMWQWRAHNANLPLASKLEARQKALQAFRQATAQRPSWPYAWSGLAYAKMVAGEFDQEFRHAMQQAVHYGPTRIGINKRIAEIGLISWPSLDLELRDLTLAQVGYAARYSRAARHELFTLAAELGREKLLCQYLQDGIQPCPAAPKANTATSPSTTQ